MDQSANVVLLVDDEEMVVTSIKSFLMLETDYEVVAFTSPQEALEYVESHKVDLVISDYLMPDMDGIEFLAHVRDTQPEATRVLLTGYADKENAIKAINDVGLYQYIEKPWDNNDLLLIIRNGLEKQMLIKKLREKIGEINSAYGELENLHKEIVKAFV